jgi:hypothetical protein
VTAKIVMTIEDEASILREFKRGAPIQSTASVCAAPRGEFMAIRKAKFFAVRA